MNRIPIHRANRLDGSLRPGGTVWRKPARLCRIQEAIDCIQLASDHEKTSQAVVRARTPWHCSPTNSHLQLLFERVVRHEQIAMRSPQDRATGLNRNDGRPPLVRLAFSFLLMSGLAAVGFGCQQPHRVSQFPAAGLPIVWPAAPDTPRIRYIGEIVGEESFGVRTSGLKALGEVFTGPAPKIRFTTPMALAVRGERAYVADGQAGAVYICDLAQRRIDTIREADGKPFEWPIDVVATDDGFAVCDSRRAGVFIFDGNNRFVRAIGAGGLQRPSAVAWRAGAKELWVLDTAAHMCVVFDATGQRIRSIGGQGAQPGAFNYPAGLTWRPGVGAVVADSMNFRVQVLDDAGGAGAVFGKKGDAAGDFAMPRDVAVDSDGNIYVLDNQFENVQIFNRSGQLLMAFGREGRGPGEFYLPSGITIDERDRIWIADSYNRRVQVFQYLRKANENAK